jgi:hypothetical protein
MAQSSATRHKIGPYSRKLRRGIIADNIDGRSTLGRFCRDLEAQLIAHVGGKPSIAQRLLIQRIIRGTVQLEAFDEKMLGGNWTDQDARNYHGLINRHRLLLREIGLEAAAAKPPSIADYLRDKFGSAA